MSAGFGDRAEAIEALVDRIYDAVFEPGLWLPVLEDLTRSVNAQYALMAPIDYRGMQPRLLASVGLDAWGSASWEQHYWKVDPWSSALDMHGANRVLLYHEYVSPEAYQNSEMYNDFVTPNRLDAFWGIGTRQLISDMTYLGLGIIRTRSQGAFDGDDMRFIERIAPHLRRAFGMAERLSLLDARQDLLSNALERLEVAILIVNCESRILLANASAHAALRAHEGLRSCPDRTVCAAAAQAEAAFKQAIAMAASSGIAGGRSLSTVHLGFRPDGTAITAHVLPLSSARFGNGGNRAVLIAIGGRRIETGGLPNALKTAYGLTGKEAEFACEIARGKSVRAVAAQLDISYETARQYMKRIFEKVGVHRQAELAAVVIAVGQSPISSA